MVKSSRSRLPSNSIGNAGRARESVIDLLTLLAIQLLVSLAFIAIYQKAFGFNAALIPVHLIIVGVITGSVYGLLAILVGNTRLRNARCSTVVLAGLPAVQTTALLLLYAIDYLANHLGSHNVTLDVVLVFATELRLLTQLLPFSYTQICGFLVLLPLSVFFIYLRLVPLIREGLTALYCPGHALGILCTPRKAICHSVGAFTVAGALIFVLWRIFDVEHRDIWDGEPVTSLFVFWDYFGDEEHRVDIAKHDKIARSNYVFPAEFDRKNVILIIGDSLRADHMQVYGYSRPTTPFLSRMLKEGKVKRVGRALATCPESACGILSSLASRNYRSIAKYNFKINDLLWDAGYNVYFLLSGDQTYYDNLRWYFGTSIDFYFDGNHATQFPMYDDHVVLEGLSKVPDAGATPAFFYFHLMSPHYIGEKLDDYNRFRPSERRKGLAAFAETDGTRRLNRYDNGTLQTDAMIEKLFIELNAKGYLENSVVFITGDHGEGLGEHGHFGHDDYLYQEHLNIPLLIFDPSDVVYKNLTLATQLDIAPTIIERLGLPVPDVWEGTSLLQGERGCCSYHETRETKLRALVYKTERHIYKFIRWPMDDDGLVKEELFELTADPGESRNLIGRTAPGLKATLDALMAKGLTPARQ